MNKCKSINRLGKACWNKTVFRWPLKVLVSLICCKKLVICSMRMVLHRKMPTVQKWDAFTVVHNEDCCRTDWELTAAVVVTMSVRYKGALDAWMRSMRRQSLYVIQYSTGSQWSRWSSYSEKQAELPWQIYYTMPAPVTNNVHCVYGDGEYSDCCQYTIYSSKLVKTAKLKVTDIHVFIHWFTSIFAVIILTSNLQASYTNMIQILWNVCVQQKWSFDVNALKS